MAPLLFRSYRSSGDEKTALSGELIVSTGSLKPEKRIMLDAFAKREGFPDILISDIGFIRSSGADGLTKLMS